MTRRKKLIGLFGLIAILAIPCLMWALMHDANAIRVSKVAAIKIGMSVEDVYHILDRPNAGSHAGLDGERFDYWNASDGIIAVVFDNQGRVNCCTYHAETGWINELKQLARRLGL